MKPRLSLIFVVAAVILLTTTLANAQNIPTSIQGITIKISTENPAPGQEITFSAESYVADLNSSNITWSLNGSLYQKGIGITSIKAKAPELGKKLNVSVSAVTSDGRTLSDSKEIGSGSVDLIMETDGYAPPFFRGKVPIAYQNIYRIIAVPHIANSSGTEYDPKTLVYQWTKDTKVIQDASGYGKQVFVWKDEIVPRSRMISVTVSTRDGTAQAQKVLIFTADSPSLAFYVNDPLYGPLYNKALGDNVGLGSKRELSVIAVPYGFNWSLNDTETSSGGLSFSWLVNAVKQAALSTNRSIILRAPDGQSGSSNISLEVRNDSDILQSARGGFAAVFKNSDDENSNNINNYNGI